MFFVATAPVEGRINLSPKGLETFRCLDDRTLGYLDLTGSGDSVGGTEGVVHLDEAGQQGLELLADAIERDLFVI